MKKTTKRDLEHRILMLELTVTALQKRLEKVESADYQPWPVPPVRWWDKKWNEVTCKGEPWQYTINTDNKVSIGELGIPTEELANG